MRLCCTFVLVSHSADYVYRLDFHHDWRVSLRPHDRRRSEICRQPGCCHFAPTQRLHVQDLTSAHGTLSSSVITACCVQLGQSDHIKARLTLAAAIPL